VTFAWAGTAKRTASRHNRLFFIRLSSIVRCPPS